MKTGMCITAGDKCSIYISEQENYWNYLPESSTSTVKGRFRFSDTASVDIVELQSVSKAVIGFRRINIRENRHTSEPIKLGRDGWFRVTHIVIPTQDWVYKELDKKGTILNVYSEVYFTDGKELFKYNKGNIEKVTVEELLEVNPKGTSILKQTQDYFSICNLSREIQELYLDIFKKRLTIGACSIDPCKANRLVALSNLIRHYIRWGQFAEAERVVERISPLKVSDKPIKLSKCGCGWTGTIVQDK
jgi:hypothetical protein